MHTSGISSSTGSYRLQWSSVPVMGRQQGEALWHSGQYRMCAWMNGADGTSAGILSLPTLESLSDVLIDLDGKETSIYRERKEPYGPLHKQEL